jgi:hypothetical protein
MGKVKNSVFHMSNFQSFWKRHNFFNFEGIHAILFLNGKYNIQLS